VVESDGHGRIFFCGAEVPSEHRAPDVTWTALSLLRSDLVCFIEPSPFPCLESSETPTFRILSLSLSQRRVLFCQSYHILCRSLLVAARAIYLAQRPPASRAHRPFHAPTSNLPTFRIIATVLIAFLPDYRHSLSRCLCPLLYATTYALPNLSLSELRWW
jgi:hypothetical protein